MKAQVFTEVGKYPILQQLDLPQPKQGEVLIKLLAAGLNHRDLYIVEGLYPGIKTPCILGSDGVGMFDGKRVVIQPGLHWGEREEVQAATYEVLGMPSAGTFAEYVSVPAENVYPCPKHLSDAEAAALPLAGLTAFRTLFTRGQAKAGDTVLVTGAGGGVASFAIQFAVAAGCRVFVSSSSDEKLAFAKTLGAEGGVRYDHMDWPQQLKKLSGGLDVVVDGAGGAGFAEASKLMNPGGRMAFYGGTRGKIPGLSPQILFWRQITLAGSTMGSPREFEQMLAFVEEHRIHPVVHQVCPLDQLSSALKVMKTGTQQGKLVLSI